MKIWLHNRHTLRIVKKILLVIFICSSAYVHAQQTRIDSLNRVINSTGKDTAKIMLYRDLGDLYRNAKKMDSSLLAYKRALEINVKNNYSIKIKGWDLAALGYISYEMGNYSESLQYAAQQLSISEQVNDTAGKGGAHLVFGHDYREMGEYREALDHYFKAKAFYKLFWVSRNKPEDNTYTKLCIAQTYLKMNEPDSALAYTEEAYAEGIANSNGGCILLSTRVFGDIYFTKENYETALKYYKQYLPDFVKYKEHNRDLGFVLNRIAQVYQNKNQFDSGLLYAKKALSNAEEYDDQENIHTAASILSDYYKNKNEHLSYIFFKAASEAKDSMISSDKLKEAQLLSFNEQVREKEQAATDAKEAVRNRVIIIISAILVSIASLLIWFRIKQLRLKYKTILEQKEAEKLKAKYEKQLLELEAKALRAQMNPHFIFNCMNSIKSLVQKKEDDKAVTYLTTFSKLIRTIFQNSDKREITLYDELETCKLYTQLESMRFGNKFSYLFNIDEKIDLKSLMVPALIIQPFIENSIWHGIMPKEEEGGYVNVTVNRQGENICCTIDDNGIGREMSRQHKFTGEPSTHHSKGVRLTQSRLDLDNILNDRNASMEVIDKKDEEGKPAGTIVILHFKEY